MPLAPSSPDARTRRALAALALVTLALPGVAKARTFSANSLIIPVQIEYQEDDAIIAAYGLVYTILLKNMERIAAGERPVTFHWAIAPNKLSQYRCNTNTNALPAYGTYNDNDGCDFAVQLSTGFPVALLTPTNGEESPFNVYETSYTIAGGPARGPLAAVGSGRTTMKYLGGAWIVDATDRQAFLEMLAAYGELAQYRDAANTKYVKIHSAKTSFNAPVARILNQKPPRIAVVETTGASFLVSVLAASGINAIANWDAAPPNGVVLERVSAATLLDSDAAGGFPRGRLNELQGSGVTAVNRYGLVWFADGGPVLSADQATNLKYFLEYGGGAYVEANSIDALENTATSRLQTSAGVDGQTPNVAYYEDCNDRVLPGGSYYRSNKSAGQSCFTYGEAAKPYAQTGNFAFEGGQGNYKGFDLNSGSALLAGVDLVLRDGATVLVSARFKDNDEEKGLVFYMAGHKFENQRYWGQRLIMNSVVSNVPLLLGVELSRSEPTGYKDVNASPVTTRVYQGTYVQLPDAVSRDTEIYNPAAPHRWKFPYIRGHLYEHDLVNLDPTGGGQDFADNKNWDAAERMPAPGSRRIFTFLGGSAHLGWKQVNFFHDQVTASTCVDTDGDAKCDLASALAACGTAGVTTDLLKTKTDTSAEAATQRNRLGMFVQQVRGHCAARDSTGAPNFTPSSDTQCLDNRRQDNLAKLGGIDHGSPAIVGPSRYVTASPWNTRPVVAYVGGRDGMLHAIYVSGGSWTAEGRSLPANIEPGTELWALIPPGQLCGLFSNDAMVDASMNVIDVLADFPRDADHDGVIDWAAPSSSSDADERPTGLRSWRTVLLATTAAGSELFALDVTNPLKPVLLWHVGGATEKDDRWDANANGAFGDAGDVKSDTNPRTYAFRWLDAADTSGLSAENGVTKEKTGRFDFRNLGLTYGTAVGKIWEGNAFRYVAYLATSTADYATITPEGFRGIEVFAVDLVTGQKLWQWQRRYARKNAAGNVIADNAIPGRPALADTDADGTVDRIYVGDMEGHLWELNAREGGNLNYLPSTTSTTASPKRYSFPLFGTPQMTATGASDAIRALFTLSGTSAGLAQQPLTSPIGLGRLTEVPSTPDTLDDHLLNRLAIIQGTMGVSWSIAPYQAGQVVILPVFWEHDSRIAYWDEGTPVNLGATRNPRMFGILDDEAVWTIALGVGERVFGMPRILNNRVVFTTAVGAFHGDISETTTDTGNLYVVHGDTTTTDSIGTKAFGGVLVFEDKLVITTATSIRVEDAPTGSTSGGTAQRPFNRATPAVFKTWEQPRPVEVKK